MAHVDALRSKLMIKALAEVSSRPHRRRVRMLLPGVRGMCVYLCRRFRKRKGGEWRTIFREVVANHSLLQPLYTAFSTVYLSSSSPSLSLSLSIALSLSLSLSLPRVAYVPPSTVSPHYNSTDVLHSLVPAVGGRGTGVEQCTVPPFNHMRRHFLRHRKRPHHTHVQRPAKDTIPAR